ncbi:MAG TPA: flavodoxin family protein [Candidatus Omnitrophota bacterium]|nr:flavodoxin family protein [Candidatus Omnitrophota bacterium]
MLIINGSPKRNGNTSILIDWVVEGAAEKGAGAKVVRLASRKDRRGCLSCRKCQNAKHYKCAISDDLTPVLADMTKANVIVMATPLYFFSASSHLKQLIDRMFSLYKWDNNQNTFTTPLKGKTLALIASAYEDVGLDALEKPFSLTASYTGMKFLSLLVPNAGTSGQIIKLNTIKEKAVRFGRSLASIR